MGCEPLRILYAFADPRSGPTTGSAVEAGQLALELDRLGERASYHVQPACSRGDLLRRLNQLRPHVLHLGGHGHPDGSIALMHPDSGEASPLSKRDLAALLAARSELRLVVLTCCYGLVGIDALGAGAAAAVGVRGELHDPYPVVFTASLYQSLAHGRSILHAVQDARVEADERRAPDAARFELWTPPRALRRALHVCEADPQTGAVLVADVHPDQESGQTLHVARVVERTAVDRARAR
jgi:hypothetical protein